MAFHLQGKTHFYTKKMQKHEEKYGYCLVKWTILFLFGLKSEQGTATVIQENIATW